MRLVLRLSLVWSWRSPVCERRLGLLCAGGWDVMELRLCELPGMLGQALVPRGSVVHSHVGESSTLNHGHENTVA